MSGLRDRLDRLVNRLGGLLVALVALVALVLLVTLGGAVRGLLIIGILRIAVRALILILVLILIAIALMLLSGVAVDLPLATVRLPVGGALTVALLKVDAVAGEGDRVVRIGDGRRQKSRSH